MSISLLMLSSPSEVLSLTTATSTLISTNLQTLNAQYNAGSFTVEVMNNSADLVYFAFGQNTAVSINRNTAYVLNPGERQNFVLPAGYVRVSAVLGGTNAQAIGELRLTTYSYTP